MAAEHLLFKKVDWIETCAQKGSKLRNIHANYIWYLCALRLWREHSVAACHNMSLEKALGQIILVLAFVLIWLELGNGEIFCIQIIKLVKRLVGERKTLFITCHYCLP